MFRRKVTTICCKFTMLTKQAHDALIQVQDALVQVGDAVLNIPDA
jgi:hypothetical protein